MTDSAAPTRDSMTGQAEAAGRPGAGAILVFTLTASSYVLPAILGGDFAKMLGTLVDFNAYNDEANRR